MQKKEWSECEKEKLLQFFHSNVYPRRGEFCHLAKSLNTSRKRVRNWFCNMRRKKIEQGILIESECTTFSNEY